MNGERLFSLENKWFAASLGITGSIAVLAAIAGLVALPLAQPDLKFSGIWDAICSAAGVPRAANSAQPVQPAYKTSNVVLASAMSGAHDAESIGRGATLAQRCAICHGPEGISNAGAPNLAGQYASAIIKQLGDFKSGARANAVMTPFALPLSDQAMLDISAYYAWLPRLPANHGGTATAMPAILAMGAPMRGIAPCAACHGGLASKAGSPWLGGQPAPYVKAQLQAFATGARHNDISQQMRNIARQMSAAEMDEAASFYGAQP